MLKDIERVLKQCYWSDGDDILALLPDRHFYMDSDGNVNDFGPLSIVDTTLNFQMQQGAAELAVSFEDDALVLAGPLTIDDGFFKEEIPFEERYKPYTGPVTYPKAKNLENAIEWGDLEFLDSAAVDLNTTDEDGYTYLMKACQGKYSSIVATMIKRGADVNAVANNNSHALTHAIVNSQVKNLELLLEAGADVNYDGKQGERMLVRAVQDHKLDLIKLLVKAGCATTGLNEEGDTLLEAGLADMDISTMEFTEHLDITRHLVEVANIDVNSANPESGSTALFAAARYMLPDTIRYLIEKSAKVNHLDHDGDNALLAAIQYNRSTFSDGQSYLDKPSFLELSSILVDEGLNVAHKNNEGKSVLDLIQDVDCEDFKNHIEQYVP